MEIRYLFFYLLCLTSILSTSVKDIAENEIFAYS